MRPPAQPIAILLAAQAALAAADDSDRCTVVSPPPAIKVCQAFVRAHCPGDDTRETCVDLARGYSRLTGGESLQALFDTLAVEREVSVAGGTVELADTLEITFGDSAFGSPQPVKIERFFDTTTRDLVAAQPDLLAVDVAPFQIVVSTGQQQPDADDVLVSVKIPDPWLLGERKNAIRVVARITSRSEFDVITGYVEIVPAIEDPPGWLTLLLPTAAFEEQGGMFSTVLSLIRSESPPDAAPHGKVRPGCLPILGPLQSMTMTSDFGPRVHPVTRVRTLHSGIDYAAAIGTPILAPADGEVRANEWFSNSTGNLLLLQHESGGSRYFTQYMHLAVPSPLPVGSRVTRGEIIGLTGNTGLSSGPHLHFEFKAPSGAKINPLGCYLLNGTWSGRYSWNCGISDDGELVGSSPLSASIRIVGHNDFQAALSYLGSTSNARAVVHAFRADGSADVSITAPPAANSVYNVFSGVLLGSSMAGTTINGDSDTSISLGCSAPFGPSGKWNLGEGKAGSPILPGEPEAAPPPDRSRPGPMTLRPSIDRPG